MVASRGLEEHLELLERVLRRLVENGLQLKFQKYKFAFAEIEYLRYKVSKDGIRPSSTHVVEMSSYPKPTNTKEVQSFQGLCSYFRRFVKGSDMKEYHMGFFLGKLVRLCVCMCRRRRRRR